MFRVRSISFFRYLKDGRKLFGDPVPVGGLLKFGLGRSEGRDRCGLTALLNAIAAVDPHAIACTLIHTPAGVPDPVGDAFFLSESTKSAKIL